MLNGITADVKLSCIDLQGMGLGIQWNSKKNVRESAALTSVEDLQHFSVHGKVDGLCSERVDCS